MRLIEGGAAVSPLEDAAATPAALRVAVIDSDSGFTQVFAKRLGAIGWRAELLASPPPLEEISRMRLHAIVIDPALLGDEAWSYLGRLCSTSTVQAVIVCTGPSSVAQRVRGLRLGADDWVTKPCHPEEVLARVEAAVRRVHSGAETVQAAEPLAAGELEIRPDMFEAFVGGRAIGLTRKEFELLSLLAGSSGRVIPREQIYERVWGYAMVHGDRSVDVFVRKLRRKLEAASPGWHYLHTHFGVGYRFDPREAEANDAMAPENPSEATLPEDADGVGNLPAALADVSAREER
jgi:DNA-binding response OmpR family regulator